MLYVVSGSQGCGKTTTINNLAAERGYKVIARKASRSLQQEWGMELAEINRDPDLTVRFQEEILHRKIIDEREALCSPLTWFTERSYADLFTYALIAIGKEPKYSDWIDSYFIKCLQLQQQYEKVFYLTAGHFPVEPDVNRAASNHHYSRMVDQTMQDITQQMTTNGTLEIIVTSDLKLRTATIGAMVTRHCQRTWQRDDGK